MAKLYETITEDNWVKKSLDTGTRKCIAGHAQALLLDGEWYLRLDEAARALFPERCTETDSLWRAYVNFNDHPDTTVEDVIRVCKVADV